MKKLWLFTLFIGCISSCQDFGKLEILASLPTSLHEISGIEKVPQSNLIWAISDSKNESSVYGYDVAKRDIERVIKLTNAPNYDWEDIAGDKNGTLYIGDFGNNQNKRKNLRIYTVPSHKDSTHVTVTNFYLEDQTKFPPKKKHRNFDIEAFIYKDGNFYLFSRNRSTDFDGTVKLYKIPAKPGTFKAEIINTFKTCTDRSDCQITAAALAYETGTIALLSHNKIWLLSDYKEDDFFSGTIQKIKLGHDSQKESICFITKDILYIADEQNGMYGGNLYRLDISK